MDNEWIVRALAMHAALTSPPKMKIAVGDVSKEWTKIDGETLQERAEAIATLIRDFAQGALNKPADPFA